MLIYRIWLNQRKRISTMWSHSGQASQFIPTSIRFISLETIKDGVIMENIDLCDKSYYVFGRNQNVCDIKLENPSISRAHLVLQHKDTGDVFLYDLESTHGTFINKKLIPSRKYIKLAVGDVFKLGQSTKSYILNGPQQENTEVTLLPGCIRNSIL